MWDWDPDQQIKRVTLHAKRIYHVEASHGAPSENFDICLWHPSFLSDGAPNHVQSGHVTEPREGDIPMAIESIPGKHVEGLPTSFKSAIAGTVSVVKDRGAIGGRHFLIVSEDCHSLMNFPRPLDFYEATGSRQKFPILTDVGPTLVHIDSTCGQAAEPTFQAAAIVLRVRDSHDYNAMQSRAPFILYAACARNDPVIGATHLGQGRSLN